MEVAVRCVNIKKSFGESSNRVPALRGVDLVIKEGELHMIVGPSGCGKTTLISIIAGILNEDEGKCEVFGEYINTLPSQRRTSFRGEKIGFVFQAFNLIPTLSALENVSIPLLINSVSRKEAHDRASHMLERVGLKERRHARSSALSGGQQQRIAIARALIHHPRLIVCDEPTSALDHENGAKVLELFSTLAREERVTTVVVTHDARIFPFATTLSRMDDGRVVEVLDRSTIETRFSSEHHI
jgi:putative ABC transport system ATP-binding protein